MEGIRKRKKITISPKHLTFPRSIRAAKGPCLPARLYQVFNWFCGLESEDLVMKRTQEHEIHLVEVTSLKQDRCTWIILNVNLVILCTLCVALYVFFSTGSFVGAK